MTRLGGGQLRFSGRSALEMMRIFLVSTRLLAGFPRAHQECFVDGAIGLHLALQFAQTHQGLVGGHRGLLQRIEVAGKRILVGFCALVFGARRKGDTGDFVVDHVLQALGLRLDFDHCRMPLAE
jgi:hypothetical protein